MPKIIDENHVFKAILQVVLERGYDNATTAEMASAANIHEATLFRKYESKARVVELAVEHQLRDAPLTHVTYTGDLRADLIAILQAYLDTFREHGSIIPTLMLEIPRHPELKNSLRVPVANIRNISSIIERYQQEKRLKEEATLLTVSVLIGPLMINAMFNQTHLDLPMTQIDLQGYADSFLNGWAVS